MDKNNFWNKFKTNNIAVNCETEDEDKEFLSLCKENKLNLSRYNNYNWDEHKNDTCYDYNYCMELLCYSSKHWYEQKHYNILSYNNIRNLLIMNKEIITFENGSVIQSVKSNDTIRGNGFINNLNNMYNELGNKSENFKKDDWIYLKGADNKYRVGKILRIQNENLIMEIILHELKYIPKTKFECENLWNNNFRIGIERECLNLKIHKIQFKEEVERQKIVDKMEVLKVEIDLALGFKNKKAFNNYVKEYKELEQELNKSEILV